MSWLPTVSTGRTFGTDPAGESGKGRKARASIYDEMRVVPVRDYKDRFILRQLQGRARMENPGFDPFRANDQLAKICWTGPREERMPVGYYIWTNVSTELSASMGQEHMEIDHLLLKQLFVDANHRSVGIGKEMLLDFLRQRNAYEVWVESPLDRTVSMLTSLGYRETEEPYEPWQMLQGITIWHRE